MFGVLYITLTGLMDSTVLNTGLWSLMGQYLSYVIKLAPILWWALPYVLMVSLPASNRYVFFLDVTVPLCFMF
ncbi:hypothetical protein DSO57_1010209 [Entomophthora muscae]|uniref:Uncharacterized protein n=1 Tax=Entomophthora muscae TaxID=34485 RepID=A0ACC2RLD7_9FUNG|nr:hypothetical protein DSO57_1010209 [Entomophthora muscae]